MPYDAVRLDAPPDPTGDPTGVPARDPTRRDPAAREFHRALHPPCRHTPYPMCPRPPLGNRLPFPAGSGERQP